MGKIYPPSPSVLNQQPVADAILLPRLLQLAGHLEGKKVCDLACGSGRISRALARRGADVVGVDLALSRLEIARAGEQSDPMGISYVHDDLTTLEALPRRVFDGVICHLALMEIEDLKGAFFSVREVLRPNGWFLFSVGHPCFQAPGARWVRRADGSMARQVSDYFAEGRWLQTDHVLTSEAADASRHRTLTTYVNTLVQSGFLLERIQEPQATVSAASRMPGYASVPPFLIIKARSIAHM